MKSWTTSAIARLSRWLDESKSRGKKKTRGRARLGFELLEDRVNPAPLLPDLHILTNGMSSPTLDTTTTPGRILMRFDTWMANQGAGAFDSRATGIPGPEPGSQQVNQRIYDPAAPLGYTEQPAGYFDWHPTHGHIHYNDFADYRLLLRPLDQSVGAVVARGEKISFCLLDLNRYAPGLPGSPSSAVYQTCNSTFEGISVGWADIYDRGLPDQYIDVTGLPNGNYWLEVEGDPANHIQESNDNNNVTRVAITLSGIPTVPNFTITSSSPVGASLAPVDHLRVRFSRAPNGATFTAADITNFNGPGGPVSVTGVTQISTTDYDVEFAPQSGLGTYTLTIGPNIQDHNGVFFDQDQSGTGGQASDIFVAVWTLNDHLGPDGFGHRAYSTANLGIDLVVGGAGVATVVDNQDDNPTALNLGTNTFNFYGTSYTGTNQLYVHPNGLITFGTGSFTNSWINTDLVSVPTVRAIAVLWDDWRTDANANDRVLSRFDDLNADGIMDRVILEWNQVVHFDGSTSNPATFQAILGLNTGSSPGEITFNYLDLDAGSEDINDAASATVGLKGPNPTGANRLLISNNAPHQWVEAGEGIRIVRPGPRVLDNGDAGFNAVGSWLTYSGPEVLRADVHFIPAGTGSSNATWTFTNLASGQYRVSATWFPTSIAATNATYQVFDGATLLATVSRNQELAPNDLTDAGASWEDLGGPHTISSGTLTVRLTDLADEYVQADAVRIERTTLPLRIIDSGESDFAVVGSWQTYAGPEVYGSDLHFIAAGAGSNTATWTFNGLSAGRYRVSATWFGTGIAASNAAYTVLNGATPLGSIALNQQQAPNDFTDAGALWEDLGYFTITGTTLAVRLSDLANGYVEADAIRVERV